MENIEKLSQINFLSVCDISMDIKEEMQITNGDTIEIPIVRQTIIRFPVLLPALAPNLMNAYYSNRIKAVIYLKEVGAIQNYRLHKEPVWDGFIEVNLDRAEFDKFYDKLSDAYERRVVEPQKRKIKDETPKFRFSNGILFRDFSDDVLIFKDENEQEFRVMKAAMNLPVNERIDALTDDMELTFRQLYDTVRRLNNKIKITFGIENFFETDSTNKLVKRVVE